MAGSVHGGQHTELPDPASAGTVAELTACLRALKVFAGDPSFTVITDRVNRAWRADGRPPAEDAARATVVDCFKPGRRRLNADLVIAVVRALHDQPGYADRWRHALRAVAGRKAAAQQVRVQDVLPPDLAEFTGRRSELALLDRLTGDPAGAVASIEGMPGVGKTQLAVRAAHRLLTRNPRCRVLFVNLRGFDPDPAQPSADPAAVLDAFLRLMGVPGSQVPAGTADRTALFRSLVAGRPAVVVLDDAADEAQVRPLLADVPGSVTLVTSRRRLAGLSPAGVPVHPLALEVFTADEARAFVTTAGPPIPLGDDPRAAGRVAVRCGGLPLALSLVVAHMRVTPGWTLTDHADRLDERHAARSLDSGLDILLEQSYQSLPPGHRRLFRLLALTPGPDVDRHAAAALADLSPADAAVLLRRLERDHLVRSDHGRVVLHDLVRAFAAARSVDEDSPAARRDALTRLFDHYTSAAVAAMDVLHPAEAGLRRRVVARGAAVPVFADARSAKVWLDTERPALVAACAHAAAYGSERHAVDLSVVLFRYLVDHPADALPLHGSARTAARTAGDGTGEAVALLGLGAARCSSGEHEAGVAAFRRALDLFRSLGDRLGEARALTNIGNAAVWQGRHTEALAHMTAALTLFRRFGDGASATNTLTSIGYAECLAGRHASAAGHLEQALAEFRAAGNTAGEAVALTNLGIAQNGIGRPAAAAVSFASAVSLARDAGERTAEANALQGLATTLLRAGQPARAVTPLRRALELCRQIGFRRGEADILVALGEAAHAAGDPVAALEHYHASLAITGSTAHQQARARTGIRRAERAMRQDRWYVRTDVASLPPRHPRPRHRRRP